MKTLMRRFALFIGFLILLLGIGTFVPRPLFPASASHAARHEILVISSAIHTDVAVPLDSATRDQFSFLEEDGLPLSSPEAHWNVLGWGGRPFYMETLSWSDLKPGPVFKALTLDRSVMHLELAADIPLSHPSVTVLSPKQIGLERLDGFILDSVERDASAGAAKSRIRPE